MLRSICDTHSKILKLMLRKLLLQIYLVISNNPSENFILAIKMLAFSKIGQSTYFLLKNVGGAAVNYGNKTIEGNN